jgi:hypothetical protein
MPTPEKCFNSYFIKKSHVNLRKRTTTCGGKRNKQTNKQAKIKIQNKTETNKNKLNKTEMQSIIRLYRTEAC